MLKRLRQSGQAEATVKMAAHSHERPLDLAVAIQDAIARSNGEATTSTILNSSNKNKYRGTIRTNA